MSGAIRTPVQIGEVLAGKYRVERILGAGGMGVVVAATHVDLHELRAIKFLLLDASGKPAMVERFLREARASVRLKSEHVARVHDTGRLESGAPYMVMEYLAGLDLRALLDRSGPPPVVDAVTYVLQAIEGVAEAHAAGIVHRDLKPANLFLTTGADGSPCVKVLDFGISKLTGPAGVEGLAMTKTTAALGTPYYMSPEQMKSSRDVDTRTDIWAFGVILFEMLTGAVPFQGESITELCARVLQEQPPPPSAYRAGLPPALDAIVLRCLEKDAMRRYANVAELAAALLPFGSEEALRSVQRSARMLRVAPPAGRGSFPSNPNVGPQPPAPAQAPAQAPSARVDVPPLGSVPGSTEPEPMAGAGMHPGRTGASWGRTGPVAPRRSSRVAMVIAGGVLLIAAVVGVGLVVSKRALSAGDPPIVVADAPGSSDPVVPFGGLSAPGPSVPVPLVSTASLAASAGTEADAGAGTGAGTEAGTDAGAGTEAGAAAGAAAGVGNRATSPPGAGDKGGKQPAGGASASPVASSADPFGPGRK